MTARVTIAPPVLDGYQHVELIGSGGFADVFLYQQEFPRQRVAIKFLVGDSVAGEQRRRFTDEANAMASVSNHPFIVSIFRADVSPEGYPYMVMEYYPRPNFSKRAKSERFQVADVLRVGVQIASAVETAHRIHILHRDIKPANILTSEYGRPGLTDFGIAAAKDHRADESEGMSIPWSPPEVVVGDGVSDERSDVYSLGATLYTLLAGRSPFEVTGDRNRAIDMIGRIQQLPVPPIDRPDVPGSLERLLAQSMSKDPATRPASAAAFARELQAIEVEQRFSMTEFEVSDVAVADEAVGTPIDVDAGATRVKQPTAIDAQGIDSATNLRSQHTFSRTFVRPPAGLRPQPGGIGGGSGPIIHQTPYIPSAPNQGAALPVVPRIDGMYDTGEPAAGTYVAAQPASMELPGGARRSRWAVVIAIVVALLMAGAGMVVVLGRDSGPPQIVQNVTVTPQGDRCLVKWETAENYEDGDLLQIWSGEQSNKSTPESRPANELSFPMSKPEMAAEFFVQALRDGEAIGEPLKAQGRPC